MTGMFNNLITLTLFILLPQSQHSIEGAHSHVTLMAAIFGAVMLQVHFDGLVLTASAAFGADTFIILPQSQHCQ
jgi:hypothetical protein